MVALRPRRASSSAVVKIAPRNSQEPSSRLTRLVCLPCQPRPAASASGFSITGAVSTKTLTSPPARAAKRAGDLLQPALDDVVIVAVARIDGDRRRGRGCARMPRGSCVRPVVHAEHDDRAHLRPQRRGLGAPLQRLGHPVHRAVMAVGEEFGAAVRRASGIASGAVIATDVEAVRCARLARSISVAAAAVCRSAWRLSEIEIGVVRTGVRPRTRSASSGRNDGRDFIRWYHSLAAGDSRPVDLAEIVEHRERAAAARSA